MTGEPARVAESAVATASAAATPGAAATVIVGPNRAAELAASRAALTAEYARTVTDEMSADEAIRRRAEVTVRLDQLYWEWIDAWQAAQATASAPEPLTEETRLLIDAGVMDSRRADPELPAKLRAEWAETAGCRVQYLSEWLQERLGTRRAEVELEAPARQNGAAYVSHLEDTRRRIMEAVEPLLANLPGTPREVLAAFRAGRLDQQLLGLGVALLRGGPRRDFLRRAGLKSLRDGVMAKLYQRAETPAQRQCLDMLQEIYRKDWNERYHQTALEQVEKQALSEAALRQPADKLREMLALDLERVHAAADHAARLGGEERATPSCWAERPRVTRTAAARMLALARSLDREGAEPPGVLLISTRGRGVYAAEMDVLAVALRPAANADDSLATALADWHTQIDATQRGGILATAFAERFPGRDFAEEFSNAYRLWLCRSAKGDARALSEDMWAFFRDFVGPPMNGPLIPANLRNLSAMTRLALRQRLERQLAQSPNDANLYRRFGALCWLDGLHDDARKHLKEALRCAPGDGETALSLGLALRAGGQEAAARAIFALGAERSPHTIWGLYCQDAEQA